MSMDLKALGELSAHPAAMLDTPGSTAIIQTLDAFHREQANLERMMHSLPLDTGYMTFLSERITRSSHALANAMIDILGEDSGGWSAASDCLRCHPAYGDFLLQSELIRRALEKPYGYADNRELMLLMCRNEDIGATAYARLANKVYQDLPICEAVRQRVRAMELVLHKLPQGSRVLCLACGPAWEVQQLLAGDCGRLCIDLLDHDPQTLAYTMGQIDDCNIRHVSASAFDIIKGRTSFPYADHHDSPAQGHRPFMLEADSYDLVYTMGLFDYIPCFPMNPARGATGLTAKLFSLLKSGGELYVGNFLKPGRGNPHSRAHQFMMEAYCDWKLIYRTFEEMHGFTSAIGPETFEATLLDETLGRPADATSTIGFLQIKRCDKQSN